LSKRKHRTELPPGQQLALKQLIEIESEYSEIGVVGQASIDPSGLVSILIRMTTSEMAHLPGGLLIKSDFEDIRLHFHEYFPAALPLATVDHERWVGEPHVLQGNRLCVFLDPSREWRPEQGMRGYLERLHQWLVDAALGGFDAETALYYPVGGILHQSKGTPLFVVRQSLSKLERKMLRRVQVLERSEERADLVAWSSETKVSAARAGLAITTADALPYGAGTTLLQLLGRLKQQGMDASLLSAALVRAATANPAGDSLFVVLIVPFGKDRVGRDHLLAFRLGPQITSVLQSLNQQETFPTEVNPVALPLNEPLEWCQIADERPEIHQRRDSQRPVAVFSDLRIQVWGAGALGSWIAEFLARAGAAEVTLYDPARVTGALLVRQNYEEDDVGASKAERIAARLNRTSDGVVANGHQGTALALCHPDHFPDCDLIIASTVDNGVSFYLGLAMQALDKKPWIAQVATDVHSATLGLLTAVAPADHVAIGALDEVAGKLVEADPSLESYKVFWTNPAPGEELLPAPGCSVPTFHGAAADVAGVSASLLTFLAQQISAGGSGVHLLALPHAPVNAPPHHYIPMDVPKGETAP
jgi:hypothetical protein